MHKKTMLIVVCCLMLILALGATTAFAASDTEASDRSGGPFDRGFADFENMSEEMKAEMEAQMGERKPEMTEDMEARHTEMQAQMEARQAKWDALTETEKEEIYDLQRQLIDKYLQLGLIEADEAALMKERLAEQNVFGRGFGNNPGKTNGSGRPFGETN